MSYALRGQTMRRPPSEGPSAWATPNCIRGLARHNSLLNQYYEECFYLLFSLFSPGQQKRTQTQPRKQGFDNTPPGVITGTKQRPLGARADHTGHNKSWCNKRR